MEIAITENYNYVQVNFGSHPIHGIYQVIKTSAYQRGVFNFFSTLDSIFIDFKDAKRHKTCIIHGFKLFE